MKKFQVVPILFASIALATALHGAIPTTERQPLVTFRVAGTILAGGSPLPGVVMAGLGGNPTTDSNGVYDITLDAGWGGTVTPTLTGYVFNPVSRTYSNLSEDQLVQDYAATLATYTISGTVTLGGAGLAGVTMAGLPGSPVTDAMGQYSASVDYGSSFTVTPTHPYYTFDPASRDYAAVAADQLGQDYTATLPQTVDRQALIALYNSTGGDGWNNKTGWKTAPLYPDGFALPGTEGSWSGVTVSAGQVTQISMYNRNMIGSLPAELGNLTSLTTLNLATNQISGPIPPELGNLTNLRYLYLFTNQLSGSIPDALGNLTSLLWLSLYANQLSGPIPASLGNLTAVTNIQLQGNQLTGSIPAEIANPTGLQYLRLQSNQLSGTIPAALGTRTSLLVLELQGNKLAGPIPSSIVNLTALYTDWTNLGYNALYSTDPTLIAFLNVKDAGWSTTQTIAPTQITAVALEDGVVLVSWLPIPYTGNTGGYRVHYSQTPGGPYTFFGQTANKTTSSLQVTGLTPDQRYYFVVQTRTDAHAGNPNIVDSAYSVEASAVPHKVTISGTVTFEGSPLAGVVMEGLPEATVTGADGAYSATVQIGWSGTVTPALAGYVFEPASRTFTEVAVDQTGQDITATAVASYTISGTVTLGGAGLAGVTMAGLPGSPVTDAQGQYSVMVNEGWSGTVTPALTYYTFDPASRDYAAVAADQLGQDYAATLPQTVDRQALIALYNSTGGDGWNNKAGWKTAPLYPDGFALPGTEGSWSGVTVSAGNVTQISMYNRNMTGSLPAELGNLTSLTTLNLATNQISGPIPPELGNLTNLQYLYLYTNQLSGPIPDALGNLTSLVWLSLNTNQLSGPIPAALGNLTNLQYLNLYENQLSGPIPAEIVNPPNLKYLRLYSNRLTGTIPAALGVRTSLLVLQLQANQLVGSIPTSLVNLTSIYSDQTNLAYNALYSTDPTLTAFLNAKDADWAATQTIAPSNITATAMDGARMLVSWLPIPYTGNTGGYRIYNSQTPGGPYTLVGQTDNKTTAAVEVTGLTPGQTYYFVVRTQTDAHGGNANIVESGDSAETSAVAWMQIHVRIAGTVRAAGSPLLGVVMAGLDGNPATDSNGVYDATVDAGWSGTVAPTRAGYAFDPVSRPYTTLMEDQLAQDYEATLLTHTISGTVTVGGTGLAGVTMAGLPGSPVTDATGFYSATVDYGSSITVTPAHAYYTFDPVSQSYTNVMADITAQNYAAALIQTPQRQALIALYNSTNGDSWNDKSGWKTAPLYPDGFAMPGTEGMWFGLTVDSGTHAVTGIDFTSNHLVGTIPAELGNLTSLQGLYLEYNSLSGSIPAELGNMTSLREFALLNNQLSGPIPVELGDLTNLTLLNLATNQLSGPIPSELGMMTGLRYLYLYQNQLSGSIPVELGTLTNLIRFYLSSNKLTGPLPTSLANLTALNPAYTDLGYNALSATDEALIAFLNSKDADWAATQTIAPSSVTATAMDGAIVLVSWLPIPYSEDAGYYKIYSSQTAGGPYTLAGQTANKSASSAQVIGLTPGQTYYFVVQTHTDAHTFNPNIVESEYSAEASAVAWQQIHVRVAGTILAGGSPLLGVVMAGLDGNPATDSNGAYDVTLDAGWSGTVTPTLAGYTFDPVSRSYTTLMEDQLAQNYTATLLTYTISGTVTVGGSPLSGVTMAGLPGSPVTDALGQYTAAVNYGSSFTITPTHAYYTFDPVSQTYTNVTANIADQNYAASLITTPQRQTLIALYNSTDGDNWTNKSGWKMAPLYPDGFAMPGTEGTWYGLTVDSGTQQVTQIRLRINNLYGTIPAALGSLTSLTHLVLDNNRLSGTIPPELGNLTSLLQLELYINQLSGTIPSELGNLSSLQYLILENNQLSGTIPPELGNLANLGYLDFFGNQLTGTIPPELGNLSSLWYLGLYSNRLSGSIPPELGNLTNLRYLFLHINQLSGSIPPELGNLASLQQFGLYINQLSGSIPPELGNLTSLQSFGLYSNALTGPIPASLANLTALDPSFVDIGYNALYSSDEALITFLNSKDADWAATQTVAPSSVTATAMDGAIVLVSWLPIPYTGDSGYYKIYSSQTAGGPYTLAGQTVNKTASSVEVNGLTPGQTYYFVVQTHTDAHANNQNIVESENSAEVFAVAWTKVNVRVTGTVLVGGSPLLGVVMAGLDGNPVTNASGVYDVTVGAGWTGTVTPTFAGYVFTPASRSYAYITEDQLAQDYSARLLTPTITVTSPNGGESWEQESTQTITWTYLDVAGSVTIDLYKAGVYQKTLGTADVTAATFSWTIAWDEAPGTDYRVLIWQSGVSDESDADFAIVELPVRKDDVVVTWDGQGVYYRNSDTGGWVGLASPANMITTGDLDGDGTDDLIGLWPAQGGIWVKYSSNGAWVRLSTTARYIAAGDMNGDGQADLLGTWDDQGVYYRNSVTGAWVKMASPATMIAAGDLDGDGTDDLIGLWPAQGGIWVKYSQTGAWAKISSTAVHIAAGDMNGDRRDDLLGTWDGQGVYYRNSITGAWVKMASPATLITAGDIDSDRTDDLIGIWPTQGGVWVKYSASGAWELLGATARDIATGKMRPVTEPEPEDGTEMSVKATASARMNTQSVVELPLPIGGTAEGPEGAGAENDLSAGGPGGLRFVYLEEKNLVPREDGLNERMRIAGPGEQGFVWAEQKNIFPEEAAREKRGASVKKEKIKQ